ncbi:MAG: thrombospondin type 3 repeat-containing protein [Deltaproteobacteria bacterium]|nr:thrombospondin type 3 repeat-containing protein [Deltaproteobacteria bacterium]
MRFNSYFKNISLAIIALSILSFSKQAQSLVYPAKCVVDGYSDASEAPLGSLRHAFNSFNRSMGNRECDEVITIANGAGVTIKLVEPLPMTFEQDIDNDAGTPFEDAYSLTVDLNGATIDASDLPEDICVFDLKNSNSIWKNMTVKVHKKEKAFCDKEEQKNIHKDGENGLKIEVIGSTTPGGKDTDEDKVPDDQDNCPAKKNPAHVEPKDCNNDGDTSDPGEGANQQCDFDGDGVGDECDNCPKVANPSQSDADKDNIGDACEAAPCKDLDGDKKCDETEDNCPGIANADQLDHDNDGVGDVCDNCPDVSNGPKTPGIKPEDIQKDSNSNGEGDACEVNDTDSDSDGILDDGDHNGTPGSQTCRGGNKANCDDNCKDKPNPNQEDEDSDGVGDACDDHADGDTDGDGINNDVDACPTVAGVASTDPAKNGCPVVTPEEPKDSDGDSINDNEDQCPNQPGTKENNGCPKSPTNPGDGNKPPVDDGNTPDACPKTGPAIYGTCNPKSMAITGCSLSTSSESSGLASLILSTLLILAVQFLLRRLKIDSSEQK